MNFSPFLVEKLALFNSDSFFWQIDEKFAQKVMILSKFYNYGSNFYDLGFKNQIVDFSDISHPIFLVSKDSKPTHLLFLGGYSHYSVSGLLIFWVSSTL